jgi:aspartate carbamoyltransferase regulatory subunit
MAKKKRQARPRVIETPPRCPRQNCLSTKRTRRQNVAKTILQRQGIDQLGCPYNEQHISYVECSDCGQKYSTTSFHFAPRNANNADCDK